MALLFVLDVSVCLWAPLNSPWRHVSWLVGKGDVSSPPDAAVATRLTMDPIVGNCPLSVFGVAYYSMHGQACCTTEVPAWILIWMWGWTLSWIMKWITVWIRF